MPNACFNFLYALLSSSGNTLVSANTGMKLVSPFQRGTKRSAVIPICNLSLNSKMREKHHRPKPFFVLGQLSECLTQHLDQFIQGRKDEIVQVFLAQFLPQMFDEIDFWTIGRLKDQANILRHLQAFSPIPARFIDF